MRNVESRRRERSLIALAYVAWFATAALGLLACISLHTGLLRCFARVAPNQATWYLVNYAMIVVLGIAWLAMTVGVESWYSRAPDFASLGRRAGRLALALAIIATAGAALSLLARTLR